MGWVSFGAGARELSHEFLSFCGKPSCFLRYAGSAWVRAWLSGSHILSGVDCWRSRGTWGPGIGAIFVAVQGCAGHSAHSVFVRRLGTPIVLHSHGMLLHRGNPCGTNPSSTISPYVYQLSSLDSVVRSDSCLQRGLKLPPTEVSSCLLNGARLLRLADLGDTRGSLVQELERRRCTMSSANVFVERRRRDGIDKNEVRIGARDPFEVASDATICALDHCVSLMMVGRHEVRRCSYVSAEREKFFLVELLVGTDEQRIAVAVDLDAVKDGYLVAEAARSQGAGFGPSGTLIYAVKKRLGVKVDNID